MRDIKWTPCCVGPNTFTIYRDHKVTRTEFMGTIVEPLSSETGLPIAYENRMFLTPAAAFSHLDALED